MSSEVLTPRQRDNRRYYAQNAEKIKAQKRASYAKRKKVKPVCKTEKSEPAVKKVAVKTEPTKTVKRKIEDFELSRELGIKIIDL